MSRKPTTYAMAMKEEADKKTTVTFRIVLPTSTSTRTVHVLGSWDDFATAYPLEEDNRVGRGVWKGSMTQGGGLEMGREYKYYLLLDHQHCIPDPQVPSDCLTVDSRSGKLCSILYVPIELPATPEELRSPPPATSYFDETSITPQLEETTISPHSVIGNSVFAGFDSEGAIFEKPREAPLHPIPARHTPAPQVKTKNSLRDKLRTRKSVAGLFGLTDDPINRESTPKRRRWAVNPKTSFLKLRYLKSSEGEPVLAQKQPVYDEEEEEEEEEAQEPRNRDEINDVVGYLRSGNPSNAPSPTEHSPHALYYSPQNTHTPNTPAYLGVGQQSSYLLSGDSHYSQATSNFTSPSLSHSSNSTNNSFHEPGEWKADSNGYTPEIYSKWNNSVDGSPEYGLDSAGLGLQKPRDSGVDVEETGYSYPRFFNFDELKGGNRDIGRYAGDVILGDGDSVRPLRSLRDDVAGELKWRDEMVNELGYLGGIVI